MIKKEELKKKYDDYYVDIINSYKEVYEKYIDESLFNYYKEKSDYCDIMIYPRYHSISLCFDDVSKYEAEAYNLSLKFETIELWRKTSFEVIKKYLSEYYIRGISNESKDVYLVRFYFNDPDDGYGHTFYVYDTDQYQNTKTWVQTGYNAKEKIDKKPWYKRIFKL